MSDACFSTFEHLNTPNSYSESLHKVDEITAAIQRVLECMRTMGYVDRDLFGVRLSLEEALSNAIRHGNRNDPAKQVRFAYQVNGQELLAEVEDQGSGFNPDRLPDPLAQENLEKAGGRGVFLMRHYMTSVNYCQRGNCVRLRKRRSAEA